MANNAENQDTGNLPWWRKAIAKGTGILVALIMLICGILSCALIFSPANVAAGIFMIAIALLMILFEAPICCRCVERTKKISEWIEQRKYWQKGVLYILVSIIPIAISQYAPIVVGFIFACVVGLIYIFMSCRKQDPVPSSSSPATNDDFGQP